MKEFLFDAYLGAGAQYGFQDPRTLEALAAFQTAQELDQISVQVFDTAFNVQGQTAVQAAQAAVAAVEDAAPAVAANYGLSDAAETLVTTVMVEQKVYEAEEYTLTGSALQAYGAEKVSYVDYYQDRSASQAQADAADAIQAFESVVDVPAPMIVEPVPMIVQPAPTTPSSFEVNMKEFLFDAYLGAGAQYGFQDPRTVEALAAFQTAQELDQISVQVFDQAFNVQGQTATQAAQAAVAAVEDAAPAVAANYGLSDAAEALVTSGMVDQKVYEAAEYTLTGAALRAYGADKVSYVDYYQDRSASQAQADAADAIEAFESVVEVPAPTITRPVFVAPAPTPPAPSVTPAPVITRPIAPAVPQLPTPVSPVTPLTPVVTVPQPMQQGMSNLALYGLGALALLLALRR